MPVLLWLALLLGYFVGVAGAIFLLPAPIVEPLAGRIIIASIVIMVGAGMFFVLQRRQIEAAIARGPSPASVVRHEAAAAAELGGSSEPRPDDDRIDDVAGDPERLGALRSRPADPFARALDGALGPRELRQILYDGRIEILARPAIAVRTRERAFLTITPRLLDHRDEVVPPMNYRRSLARCGLEPVFDRVQVIRALQAVEAAHDGEAVPLIACTIGVASLASPVLLDGLEDTFRDHVGRGERLILELDRVPRDPKARHAVRRLTRQGVRLGLKRLSVAPLDLERMAELGFQFVRLAAPRFAALPGAAAGTLPSLGALLAASEQAGITVVVHQADSAPAPLLDEGRLEAPLPASPEEPARDDAA